MFGRSRCNLWCSANPVWMKLVQTWWSHLELWIVGNAYWLKKFVVFWPKIWEIFGQLCFSSVNSNNFANFWEISPNSWYHKIGKTNPDSRSRIKNGGRRLGLSIYPLRKTQQARKELSSSQMPRLGVSTPPAGGFLKRFATHCTNLLVARIVTTATARISPPVSVEILLLEPAPVDVLPIDPNLPFTNHVGSSSLGSAHDKPTQNYIPGQQNIRQPQLSKNIHWHLLRRSYNPLWHDREKNVGNGQRVRERIKQKPGLLSDGSVVRGN